MVRVGLRVRDALRVRGGLRVGFQSDKGWA